MRRPPRCPGHCPTPCRGQKPVVRCPLFVIGCPNLLEVLAACLACFWAAPGAAAEPRTPSQPPGLAAEVDYARDIRPILAKNCFACHGQDEAHRARKLRLDRRAEAIRTLDDGASPIVPGKPDDCELIVRVTEEDESLRMPPPKAGPPLAPAQVALLRRWIEQGAPYAEHWALVRPQA